VIEFHGGEGFLEEEGRAGGIEVLLDFSETVAGDEENR
jgi:hypothetical protein